MKLKRIIAGMAAAVMSISVMSIGANATAPVSTFQYYRVYSYSQLPPGIQNRTTQIVGDHTGTDWVFSTENANNLRVIDKRDSITTDYISLTGSVYKSGGWIPVMTFYHNSNEFYLKSSGNCYVANTPIGSPAQVQITLHIPYQNIDADGEVVAR